METYEGVKFRYRLVEKELPKDDVKRYLELDARLKEFLDPQENEGNMSMRLAEGFLVKRAGAKMTELTENDVSLVVSVEEDEVVAAGVVPSSEARMHHGIYKAEPTAKIILHFHNNRLLEKFEEPTIGPFPYGTLELAEAAGKAAKSHWMFKIREHGFVLIAKDKEEFLQSMKTIPREW